MFLFDHCVHQQLASSVLSEALRSLCIYLFAHLEALFAWQNAAFSNRSQVTSAASKHTAHLWSEQIKNVEREPY